jgi:hypothetical protein
MKLREIGESDRQVQIVEKAQDVSVVLTEAGIGI